MSKAKTPVFFGTKTNTAVNDENASSSISTLKTAAPAAPKKTRSTLSNITHTILNTNQTLTLPKSPSSKTVLQSKQQFNPTVQTMTMTMSPPVSPRRERSSPYKSPGKSKSKREKSGGGCGAVLLATPVKKDGGKYTYHPDFMRIVNQKSDYCHLSPYPNPSSVIEEYNRAMKLAHLDLTISDPSFSPVAPKEANPIPSIEIDLDSDEPPATSSSSSSSTIVVPALKQSSSQKSVAFDLGAEKREEDCAKNEEEDLGEDGLLNENEYFKFGVYSETNPRRLEMRQKQIDIGKNTPGYANYRRLVPKEKRRRGDPQTPNIHQVCSKRSWDGQIRKWRRLLHLYDPPELQSANSSSSHNGRYVPRTPQPQKSAPHHHHHYTPQPRRAPASLFPSPFTANSQYRGYGQMATPSSPTKLANHVSGANVSPYSTPLRV